MPPEAAEVSQSLFGRVGALRIVHEKICASEKFDRVEWLHISESLLTSAELPVAEFAALSAAAFGLFAQDCAMSRMGTNSGPIKHDRII